MQFDWRADALLVVAAAVMGCGQPSAVGSPASIGSPEAPVMAASIPPSARPVPAVPDVSPAPSAPTASSTPTASAAAVPPASVVPASGGTTFTFDAITVTLPAGYVADSEVDEGLGFRPEAPLLTARTAEANPSAFRLGHLMPSWDEGDPEAIGTSVVQDYFAPLLGNVGILGFTGRELEVAGASAYETVLVSNRSTDGEFLIVDIVVVDTDAAGLYLELMKAYPADADVPEGVFLPDLRTIAESVALP